MLTNRYHATSIIAIFMALGIGILLGGTLGQQWLHHTEENMLGTLLDKYHRQVMENKSLQQKVSSLDLLVNYTLMPNFERKKIWWIRPDDLQNDLLGMVMKSAGAEWIEKASHDWDEGSLLFDEKSSLPDIMIVSDPSITALIEQMKKYDQQHLYPLVIDASHRRLDSPRAEDIAQFVLYLKTLMEEEAHATVRIDRHSGME